MNKQMTEHYRGYAIEPIISGNNPFVVNVRLLVSGSLAKQIKVQGEFKTHHDAHAAGIEAGRNYIRRLIIDRMEPEKAEDR